MPADPYKYFRLEARELIEQLTTGVLELDKGGGASVAQRLLRAAHTLKGAARVVRQAEIADRVHALEEALAPFRDTPGPIPAELSRTLFTQLDAIAGLLARLDEPPAAAVAATDQPATAPPPHVSPRADITDVDALLDGIGEIHTRASTLRGLGTQLTAVRQLAEVLQAQLAPRPRLAFDPAEARELVRQLHDRIVRSELTLDAGLDHMARELIQLRDAAEQLRLHPAASMFTSLERTVRDAGHELGKRVAFEGRGGDVRVDSHVLASVLGALVQLARNAVAHGIESPAQRSAARKPAAGQVIVDVARRGRRLVFTCRDDGRGVDLDAVRAVARQRGLSADGHDANELVQMLLRGGITTSSQITAVAGRGIGLDVVREVTDRLGGEVTVQTGPAGTSVELSLPASLTSIEAVVVESAGASAALPLASVRRTTRITSSELSRTARGESVLVEGRAVPFLRLASALRAEDARRRTSWIALVIAHESRTAAVGVDRLAGTAAIVVRPLPGLSAADPVVAGAAFDAEGAPQLVLDPERLVALAHSERAVPEQREVVRPSVLVIDDSLTTRMLEQSILESAGYDVDTAVSGEQGLEAARRKRYALFLVDVEMPGIDGFTFVERVCADPALRDTPAILVTSRGSAEDRRRGEEVGARGYIVKGEFDQVDLLARIERMVR